MQNLLLVESLLLSWIVTKLLLLLYGLEGGYTHCRHCVLGCHAWHTSSNHTSHDLAMV